MRGASTTVSTTPSIGASFTSICSGAFGIARSVTALSSTSPRGRPLKRNVPSAALRSMSKRMAMAITSASATGSPRASTTRPATAGNAVTHSSTPDTTSPMPSDTTTASAASPS